MPAPLSIGFLLADFMVPLAAKMAEEPFKLLIMDSITGNLRVDFCGRGELAERQQKLGQLMQRLRKVGRWAYACVISAAAHLEHLTAIIVHPAAHATLSQVAEEFNVAVLITNQVGSKALQVTVLVGTAAVVSNGPVTTQHHLPSRS